MATVVKCNNSSCMSNNRGLCSKETITVYCGAIGNGYWCSNECLSFKHMR